MKWLKRIKPDGKTCSSENEKWEALEAEIAVLQERRDNAKTAHIFERNPSESQRLFFEIQHLTAEISRANQVQQDVELWLVEQACEGWGC